MAGSGGALTAYRFPNYERQMISPDWKRFEELAAAIQTELASDARVTPNAKLPGKSGGLRQIDILIEQRAGQYDLRIVVDCKDYKNPVDIKDVESFLGLVSDVGAHKGAMVAANGFTAAAKERAAAAGLDLFRLVDTANHNGAVTSPSRPYMWITRSGSIPLASALRVVESLAEILVICQFCEVTGH